MFTVSGCGVVYSSWSAVAITKLFYGTRRNRYGRLTSYVLICDETNRYAEQHNRLADITIPEVKAFLGRGAPVFPTPAIPTPAFPTLAIETIGLGIGLGLGIAGVRITGVGIAVCPGTGVGNGHTLATTSPRLLGSALGPKCSAARSARRDFAQLDVGLTFTQNCSQISRTVF